MGQAGRDVRRDDAAHRRLHRSWRRRSAAPIDNEANVQYQNASGKLDYNPSDRVNLFFRAGVFDEDRNNGKIGELNDTNWKYGSGGVRLRLSDGSNVEGRVFFDRERFLPEYVCGAGGDSAAQPEQSDAREERADQRGRLDGAVVARVSGAAAARTSCRPAPISAGSTATATS